ncbi:MAG: Ig domain-containing protein [Lachnospiraceae bacterium]|nr:Ig domain-containing protein [Lachnospiraceae bacterium]
MTDLDNRTISINVKAAPKNIVYLVDAGAGSVEERNNYIASDNTVLKNKTTADQAYSVVNKWGHVGNNTTARTLTSGNIYEMLRYVSSSDNRNLLYQFDELEEGKYSVYVGLHEPSGWYSSTRIANISVKQGETVLAKSEENYGKKGDAGRYVVYENLELQGTDSVQVVLNPKNTGSNTDVQISFIAIVDNTIRKGDGDQNGGNGDNNNGDQNGGNGDNNNGNQNGGNGDSNNGNQNGGNGDNNNGNQNGGNGDSSNGSQNGGNEDNNNGNQNGESEQKVPASSITLNTKKLYIVKGKNIQLKAMMMPANTTDTLIWSSSKESVATVSDGKIKAKKVGNTKVTVTTTSGKKVTCKVYVVNKAKKSVSVKLNKKKLTMKTGSISILTATLKPAKSTDTIKWKSSNKKVASVDKYGYITAKKKGKATITATTKSGKKAKCIINVK